MQLQNPKQTKILLVTLMGTTPTLKAANLQADLRRAGMNRGLGSLITVLLQQLSLTLIVLASQ